MEAFEAINVTLGEDKVIVLPKLHDMDSHDKPEYVGVFFDKDMHSNDHDKLASFSKELNEIKISPGYST